MSYTALYRKFRPDSFSGIIGQEHIVRTLKNQIASGRVSHAYLFCGTRGTGKTSTAKIFAKAINCISLEEGEPCGKCDMCRAIEEGRSVNVIEIDAASNNSVDNIREIREEVKYPPAEGKYKVYIIDEVHMLSQGAYNALLKTLEEPPEHVMFILATTDPQKVPATIHSRCQRFNFKRITSEEIAATLRKYVDMEGIEAEDNALRHIAVLSDGSLRDSLSILDQCVSFFFDETITAEKVRTITGTVDDSVFFDIANAIFEKDIPFAMDVIDEVVNSGRDIKRFLDGLIVHIRNLLVALTVDEAETILDTLEESSQRLKEQAQKFSPEELINLINVFSALQPEMRYASNPRILMEVEIIKLSALLAGNDYSSIAAKLVELERKMTSGALLNQPSANTATVKKGKKKNEEVKKERQKAVPEDVKAAIENWERVSSGFDVITSGLLKECFPEYMEDGRLTVVCSNAAIEKLIKERAERIKSAFDSALDKDFDVKTVTKDNFDAWKRINFGETEESDPEFESLMSGYIPDLDFEE
ncbi:MAG: DNA polymerase III subunit gamma/tau [Firmicutes bacterium]|nr:DNA polymerase III subunit gamma/tau [Bacillota bacterium]